MLMQAMTLDRDDHCKVAAIEALGSLKNVDKRTEGYLVRALDNEDPRIRYAALRSLRKISGKDLGSKPEPWRAYVLAKYGEKIEPPTTAIAAAGSLDRAASPASMFPSVRPPGPAPSGDVWSRATEIDDNSAPISAAGARPTPRPLPASRPCRPRRRHPRPRPADAG